MVASSKDRIYVALYGRGGLDPTTYRWAIIVGPKNEVEGGRGFRHHARQRLDPAAPVSQVWRYEALDVPLAQTSMLLARVMIGKVIDGAQLSATLAAVPLVQNDPAWTCRIWVRNGIAAMEADGKSLGTRVTDWQRIEQTAKAYVLQKRQQRRYDGSGTWRAGTVPIYDLLEAKETVP